MASAAGSPTLYVPEETVTTRVVILSCFLAYFALCAGVYMTTSRVERAPLPDLSHLPASCSDLSWQTNLHVVLADDTLSTAKPFCDRLEALLHVSVADQQQFNVLCSLVGADRLAAAMPKTEEDMQDFDDLLKTDTEDSSDITVFIIKGPKELSVLGKYKHAWITTGGKPVLELVQRCSDLVRAMWRPIVSGSDAVHQSNMQVHSQRSYLLSFSLLIDTPSKALSWSFKDVLNAHLTPFLDEIRNVFNARVDSQVVYFADIVDGINVGRNNVSFITPSQLETFIGRTKWNVESIHTPSFPALHFFIYIPPRRHTPLTIRPTAAAPASTSFMLPRWGGLVIGNSLETVNSPTDERISSVMGVVVAQIRTLLGLPLPAWSVDGVDIDQLAAPSGVAQWEVDLARRDRIRSNHASAVQTLGAFSSLLRENLQLPVEDHVAALVHNAVSSLHGCRSAIMRHEYKTAFDMCLDAHSNAQSAFFDETMIPLMYFPDEHVYAVYTPFFVPILMPVLSRTVTFIKDMKRRYT
ncbi:GPI transamidase component PIG-S [Plasmodiophora brassicae]|uniref:GPI transamidase component PIG-S n=1 Tax=Plasmodiophora brassicae TaxID=37360 RepID=A0A3P3YBV7_PLABS|nr:unnamed protein product [Plasmodiophora brassicae]